MFGNGKTSVKFNFGRYLEAAQKAGRSSRSTHRPPLHDDDEGVDRPGLDSRAATIEGRAGLAGGFHSRR